MPKPNRLNNPHKPNRPNNPHMFSIFEPIKVESQVRLTNFDRQISHIRSSLTGGPRGLEALKSMGKGNFEQKLWWSRIRWRMIKLLTINFVDSEVWNFFRTRFEFNNNVQKKSLLSEQVKLVHSAIGIYPMKAIKRLADLWGQPCLPKPNANWKKWGEKSTFCFLSPRLPSGFRSQMIWSSGFNGPLTKDFFPQNCVIYIILMRLRWWWLILQYVMGVWPSKELGKLYTHVVQAWHFG